MKILIVGAGSIGSRHAVNLAELGAEIYCFDKDTDQIKNLIGRCPKAIVYDPVSHHIHMDAWVICTPPNYHIPFAVEALKHEPTAIFIEKPLSNSLTDGAEKFLEDASKAGVKVQIGYQFRYHPAILAMKQIIDTGDLGKIMCIRAEFGQYLPAWHPWEDYRRLYTATDGIILDASHEIDYCMWLANDKILTVHCTQARLSDLQVAAEDTAEIILRTTKNIIISLHVDMTQMEYSRGCKVIGTRGVLIWKYPNPYIYSNIVTSPIEKDGIFPMWADEQEFPNADMYKEEMKAFVDCIKFKNTEPTPNGYDGLRALKIALECKKAQPLITEEGETCDGVGH